MNKSAPSLLRILTMVVFALSCFGLLLFLWLSFGGPIPLKPQGYRVQVAFPEAATLATEADVRIAGVSVGKVRKLEVDERPQPHAWRRSSSTASSRRCTPTRGRCCARRRCWARPTWSSRPGTRAEELPEGGRLANAQVSRHASQLDEIFDSLDPETRSVVPRPGSRSWRRGSRAAGATSTTRSARCRASPPTARTCCGVLDSQEAALQRLVKNTGVTFAALTENEQQLQTLITSSKRVFDATASRNDALAEAVRIFPTFLDESKATLARLETFSTDTRPLVQDLRPVARRPQADARRRARDGAATSRSSSATSTR